MPIDQCVVQVCLFLVAAIVLSANRRAATGNRAEPPMPT